MGYNTQETLSVALKVCTKEFAVDGPPSLGVVQVSIEAYVFCHRGWGRGRRETPRSGYPGVGNSQGCPAECQAGDGITVS